MLAWENALAREGVAGAERLERVLVSTNVGERGDDPLALEGDIDPLRLLAGVGDAAGVGRESRLRPSGKQVAVARHVEGRLGRPRPAAVTDRGLERVGGLVKAVLQQQQVGVQDRREGADVRVWRGAQLGGDGLRSRLPRRTRLYRASTIAQLPYSHPAKMGSPSVSASSATSRTVPWAFASDRRGGSHTRAHPAGRGAGRRRLLDRLTPALHPLIPE